MKYVGNRRFQRLDGAGLLVSLRNVAPNDPGKLVAELATSRSFLMESDAAISITTVETDKASKQLRSSRLNNRKEKQGKHAIMHSGQVLGEHSVSYCYR